DIHSSQPVEKPHSGNQHGIGPSQWSGQSQPHVFLPALPDTHLILKLSRSQHIEGAPTTEKKSGVSAAVWFHCKDTLPKSKLRCSCPEVNRRNVWM
ncbi:hypothetical protein XENOCAPTIV_011554, partial [Xenoophorus captivus]